MELNLENKTVMITGATGGIGKEICKTFAEEKANICFSYHSSEDRAKDLINDLQKIHPEGIFSYSKVNVQDEEECKNWTKETINQYGQIDILINNAGIIKDGLLLMQNSADFDQVIQTNLYSVYYLLKHVGLHMYGKRKGSIVNISSLSGVKPSIGQVNYSAAKAAVIAMGKTAARELGMKNIRVNTVAPGFVDTDMTRSLKDKDTFMKQTPLGRFAEPSEIADLVVYLSSDRASFIHGETILIDGGFSL